MECERVGEGAGLNPRCWVYYETGRFVYYDQRVVFVNNIKGNVVGSKGGGRGCRQFDFDLITLVQFVRYFRRFTVYQNLFPFYQPLQTAPTPTPLSERYN